MSYDGTIIAEPIDIVLRGLDGAKPAGERKWVARCPAHEDRSPSLSIAIANDGRVLLKCFAGCSAQDIVAKLGMAMADLFPLKGGNGNHKHNGKAKGGKTYPSWGAAMKALDYHLGERAGFWPYRDADGNMVAMVGRWDSADGKKTFRPVSLHADGWKLRDPAGKWPLYRIEELKKSGQVFVAEGEKCADAGCRLGLIVVTSAHGAQSPHKTDWAPLAGRDVLLLPDNDAAGAGYVQAVAAILAQLSPPATVRILELPGLGDGEDIFDFIARREEDGKAADEIRQEIDDLAKQAKAWAPPPATAATLPDSEPVDKRENFLTDLGNARRLADVYKDLRYCFPLESWFCFDGKVWAKDRTGHVTSYAKRTVVDLLKQAREIMRLAAKEEGGNDKALAKAKEMLSWAMTSQSATRLRAMIDLARSERGIPIVPELLDADSSILNVQNGILDLKTGKLGPHEREGYCTRIVKVPYDPQAKSPRWERFLNEIMDGDKDMVSFLARAVGYSLTGSQKEQCLFFLHGIGCNGKSVFLAMLLHVLGEYACQGVAELLTLKGAETHPTERADLFGRRLVALIETENGKRLAESLVKQLTGSDKIKARFMRQDFFEFEPTHHLWLAGNHKPKIVGQDLGIWRRIKLIPFEVNFEGRQDPHLLETLQGEAPGILAWAVRGCLEWREGGLNEPAPVKAAVENYRAEQDRLGTWLSECCLEGPDYRERSSALYGSYKAWTEKAGEYTASQTVFGEEMSRRGYQKVKSMGMITYLNLALKTW